MYKSLLIAFYAVVLAFLFCFSAFAQQTTPGDAIETTNSGRINWTTGEIMATGIGVPSRLAVNPAQARAMTERAGFLVAIRNLLEVIQGVRIDSETVVENVLVKNDVIRTRVEGIVQGARVVKTDYFSDGSVEVQVAIPIQGAFLDTLVPQTFGGISIPSRKPTIIQPQPEPVPPSKPGITPSVPEKRPDSGSATPVPAGPGKKEEPSPPVSDSQKKELPSIPSVEPEKKVEPVQPSLPASEPTIDFKGGVATGVVIDGRGTGLRPALLPRILDPQGQEIYVGKIVTRTNVVEQGAAGYAKEVQAAAHNFRVTDNPAVIKATGASGKGKTDIVVGAADAEMLRRLNSQNNFLQYCRVIIVY
ncbi:MAG: hypothetical protein WC539_02475 [Nitrospirota bacterium]